MRVVCACLQSNELRSRFAEACYRWTPELALGNEALFLEIGKCRALYREETLLLRLRRLAARFGVPPGGLQLGVANDPGTALSFAKWGVNDRERLPIDALLDYVNPFRFEEEKFEQTRQMIELLGKLGVVELKQFTRLPPSAFPSRFGKWGLHLRQRVELGVLDPWPRWRPPEEIRENQEFEAAQPFTDLEPLLFTVKPLLDRILARVRGRGKRLAGLRLTLQLERYSTLRHFGEAEMSWVWNFPLPQGSASSVIPLLRERLSFDLGARGLRAPVTGVELEVLELAPGRGSQTDFFQKHEEDQEAWASLYNRLTQKLSDGRCFVARLAERYRPEAAWRKEVSPPVPEGRGENALRGETPFLPFGLRPLRLLKEPLPLVKEMEGNRLLLRAAIRSELGPKRWRVLEVQGPELFSGEWWSEAFERSYFRVFTDTDEILWLYQQQNAVFLHGFFD